MRFNSSVFIHRHLCCLRLQPAAHVEETFCNGKCAVKNIFGVFMLAGGKLAHITVIALLFCFSGGFLKAEVAFLGRFNKVDFNKAKEGWGFSALFMIKSGFVANHN